MNRMQLIIHIKYLIVILFFLPQLSLSQGGQSMDTIESSQTEKRGDLRYQIGSDEPFTGTAITTFGEGVDGHFIGVVRTYVNGKQVK